MTLLEFKMRFSLLVNDLEFLANKLSFDLFISLIMLVEFEEL